MRSRAISLKGRIKNYAKSNSIAAQVVLQNYMVECFLARLSVSEYSEKFVYYSSQPAIDGRKNNRSN